MTCGREKIFDVVKPRSARKVVGHVAYSDLADGVDVHSAMLHPIAAAYLNPRSMPDANAAFDLAAGDLWTKMASKLYWVFPVSTNGTDLML